MPTPFGKYQLRKKLGTGGMGEVFLASVNGDDPGSPLVVIKRILPHLTENEQVLNLFLDEARIAAHLQHPHIAQLHEMGEVDGIWYLAMEFVDGADLARIVRLLRNRRERLPLPVVCRVIADAAAGLHHAHQACDRSGLPLGIIHRDVSPHNILVGFNGVTKLIDFGVARAAARSTSTETGLVRGKLAYMSPEQASAEGVDPRSDVFALGIVLWEALTLGRLFNSESEALTLHRVVQCKVTPPSQLVDGIAPALDELCMRALKRQPHERYADAGEFCRAVQSVAHKLGADFSDGQVGDWLRALWGKEAPRTGVSSVVGLTDEGEKNTGPSGLSEGMTRAERPAVSRLLDPLDPEDEVEAPSAPRSPWAHVPRWVPVRTTALVGRERERARLESFFLCGERLVTLHGPAGIGKTCLALTFAAAESPEAAVVFCPLSEVRDVAGICLEVCRAVGLGPLATGGAAEMVTQTGAALEACAPLLVVLDEFEHLVRFAPETLAVWLKKVPHVRFLITSRVQLSLEAELAMELEPLDAESSAALVRQVNPTLGPAETHAVALACQGLPLAVKIQASPLWERGVSWPKPPWGRPLTASMMVQQALQQLSPAQRRAAAQCAVFRAGFTPAAGAAVAQEQGAIERLEQVGLLTAVVMPGPGLEKRYMLSETFRARCAEELKALGTANEARARHARFFLGQLDPADIDEGDETARARSRDRDNLLAAFRWALESTASQPGADDSLLACVVALDSVLTAEGPEALHLTMLETAMESLEDEGDAGDSPWLTRALLARGRALRQAGRLAEAGTDFNQALRRSERLKDTQLEGWARLEVARGWVARRWRDEARNELRRVWSIGPSSAGLAAWTALGLGTLALEAKDDDSAELWLGEAAERAAKDAHALHGQRHLAMHQLRRRQGQLEAAASEAESAVQSFRAARDAGGEARALHGLGLLYRERTLPAEAAECFKAAEIRFRATGQPSHAIQALSELSGLEQEHGQLAAAALHARRALALARLKEERPIIAVLLTRLGLIFTTQKVFQRARATFDLAGAQLGVRETAELEPLFKAARAYYEACRMAELTEHRQEQRTKLTAALAEAESVELSGSGLMVGALRDAVRLLRMALI